MREYSSELLMNDKSMGQFRNTQNKTVAIYYFSQVREYGGHWTQVASTGSWSRLGSGTCDNPGAGRSGRPHLQVCAPLSAGMEGWLYFAPHVFHPLLGISRCGHLQSMRRAGDQGSKCNSGCCSRPGCEIVTSLLPFLLAKPNQPWSGALQRSLAKGVDRGRGPSGAIVQSPQ